MPASAEWQLQKIRELLEADDPWDDAERTLAFPIFDSVAPTDMADITSGAGADLFGNWVELVADVGTRKRLFFGSVASLSATRVDAEYEFGEGTIGNETAVARASHVRKSNNAALLVSLYVVLTDNARLSVRVRDRNVGAFAHRASALIAPIA